MPVNEFFFFFNLFILGKTSFDKKTGNFSAG